MKTPPVKTSAMTRRDPLQAPRPVMIGLLLIAIAYVGIMLILPLAAVFVEALRNGWQAARDAIVEEDALAAIKLTLMVAALLALLALVTLVLKSYLEWRHHDALAASGH